MNYYQARGWPRVTEPETRSPLDHVTQRMRELGATPDELAAVVSVWGLDPVEDQRLLYMPDQELRAEIVAVRTEYEVGTVTEEEAANRDLIVTFRHTAAEAHERVGGTIPAIMAWVADDPIRAYAVRLVETDGDGAARSTLLNQLDKITKGDETVSKLVGLLSASDTHTENVIPLHGPRGTAQGGGG